MIWVWDKITGSNLRNNLYCTIAQWWSHLTVSVNYIPIQYPCSCGADAISPKFNIGWTREAIRPYWLILAQLIQWLKPNRTMIKQKTHCWCRCNIYYTIGLITPHYWRYKYVYYTRCLKSNKVSNQVLRILKSKVIYGTCHLRNVW